MPNSRDLLERIEHVAAVIKAYLSYACQLSGVRELLVQNRVMESNRHAEAILTAMF